MKCISLWQPWASLMAHGLKHVETRSWPTGHRGSLLIHAAKKWGPEIAAICTGEPFRAAMARMGCPVTADERTARNGWGLPFGAVVGVVSVQQCYRTENVFRMADEFPVSVPTFDESAISIGATEVAFGDYRPNRWAWLTSDAFRFPEPIPCRGMQQIFDVPEDVAKVIEGQLLAAM